MSNGTELEGTIERALPRGLYMVRLDDGRSIRATLSTSAKRVTVKVLEGDRVLVEMSAFDTSRGRIKVRLS